MVKQMTVRNQGIACQAPRRQFSLAGLLSFVLAASVYFSMIASLRSVLSVRDWERHWWPILVTIPTAWCVLWLLYRRWQLRQAVMVHLSGPIMALTVVLLFSFVAILESAFTKFPDDSLRALKESLEFTLMAALVGCGWGTAVSLPAAALMLLYLCTRTEG